ncbi:MAG: DUF3108 domain-containing protein [Rhizobiales bacterium]|nr:DUF3108 domain-containing protein [Hyphomicrobiales bacterium]
MSLWLGPRSGVVATVAAVVGFVAQATGSGAQAQGRLDARYTASLAGIPIGRGAWVIDIGDDKYLAAASGATAGIMRLFSGGEGTGASRGRVVNGQLVPATYAASISSSQRKNEVRIALKAGAVKDLSVSPPVTPESERVPLSESHRRGVIDPMTASLLRVRVPLSESHRRGVIDPMTASLLRVAASGDPLVPNSCQRTVSVFDGRMRYDLHLAYKRMDQVKAAKGYTGPALVCAIYFSPVAGHIPDRAAIKYLAQLRDMEIWLTPIAGTSVLVPFRLSIPTPFGLGVLEATQFLTIAHRTRAATSGATQ